MTTQCADATALDSAPLNTRSSATDFTDRTATKKSLRPQRSALNAGLLIGSAGLCILSVVAWLLMVF
ncbi:hypothetical protein ACTL6U_01770 [Rhodovibrionaceae bacterium A322]